jgi:hypothetical protein
MDIEKIERLLSRIAKGDKATINNIVDLLEELATHDGTPPQRQPEQRRTAPAQASIKEDMSASSRASMILEGNFEAPYTTRGPLDIPYAPPYNNPYGQTQHIQVSHPPMNPNEMINKPDVRNHADSILW